MPRGHLLSATRRAAKIGVAMLVVSLVLAAGAFATSTLYGQYGAPRTGASALAWAGRTVVYSITDCRECHSGQAAAEATAGHADLICETCHVPSVAHPGNVAGTVQPQTSQTSALCAACHAEAAGRPIRFPQVDPVRHFPGAVCLQCHDPHTTAAATPPDVVHPLQNLPPCTTCHAPGGLKRFPAGHQPAADNVCLGCHQTRRLAP
jgi:hypothetical protein